MSFRTEWAQRTHRRAAVGRAHHGLFRHFGADWMGRVKSSLVTERSGAWRDRGSLRDRTPADASLFSLFEPERFSPTTSGIFGQLAYGAMAVATDSPRIDERDFADLRRFSCLITRTRVMAVASGLMITRRVQRLRSIMLAPALLLRRSACSIAAWPNSTGTRQDAYGIYRDLACASASRGRSADGRHC